MAAQNTFVDALAHGIAIGVSTAVTDALRAVTFRATDMPQNLQRSSFPRYFDSTDVDGQEFLPQPSVGRPAKEVNMAVVDDMIELNFSKSEISKTLGISRPTLYAILAEKEDQHKRFSTITDDDLNVILSTIKTSHPCAGEIYIMGHLEAQGLRVQRSRVRNLLKNNHQKLPLQIRRREYFVPCPNYLWHLDGLHKLINWKLVVHAGIDGYSRTLLYAKCATNNEAQTVFPSFQKAIQDYGLPLHVRTDAGGENTLIWEHMYHFRRPELRPVLVGSSVHNTRVERINRDLNVQVLYPIRAELYELEDRGVLSRENDVDIFCAQYVYQPILNKRLREFQAAHNNHKISTEGNKTPNQITYLYKHLLHVYENEPFEMQDMPENLNGHLARLSVVQVANVRNPLNVLQFADLALRVNPLLYVSGIDAYRDVSRYVGRCMRIDRHT